MQDYSSSRRNCLALAGTALTSLLAAAIRPAHAQDEVIQPEFPDATAFMGRALEMSNQSVSVGDQPYGAVLVKDRRIVAQARSRVVTRKDPTAHAEMEVIRDAARRLGGSLRGCTLYASSKPCPMCEAAAYWAEVDTIIYSESLTDGGSPELCG